MLRHKEITSINVGIKFRYYFYLFIRWKCRDSERVSSVKMILGRLIKSKSGISQLLFQFTTLFEIARREEKRTRDFSRRRCLPRRGKKERRNWRARRDQTRFELSRKRMDEAYGWNRERKRGGSPNLDRPVAGGVRQVSESTGVIWMHGTCRRPVRNNMSESAKQRHFKQSWRISFAAGT